MKFIELTNSEGNPILLRADLIKAIASDQPQLGVNSRIYLDTKERDGTIWLVAETPKEVLKKIWARPQDQAAGTIWPGLP